MRRSARGLGLNAQCVPQAAYTHYCTLMEPLICVSPAEPCEEAPLRVWTDASTSHRRTMASAAAARPWSACAAARRTLSPGLKECAVSLPRSSKVTPGGQLRCWRLCREVYAQNPQSLAVVKAFSLEWMTPPPPRRFRTAAAFEELEEVVNVRSLKHLRKRRL